MLGLLGYLGAGGAKGYADARNAQVEALNKIESALISAEANDWYAQRREERAGRAEAVKYQRDVERDDMKFERDRSAKKEDFGMTAEHDLKKLGVAHGYSKDLEGMKQSSAERRTQISQAGAMERAKLGLLNNGSRGSSGASGELSQKEIARANEGDRKRIFDLRKELTDPMVAHNAGQSELLKQEIMRLEDGIAQRIHGDSPLNLNALHQ